MSADLSFRRTGMRLLANVAWILGLVSPSAPHAESPRGPLPNIVIFVGSGVGCDYFTVQEAINAAAARPGEDTIAIARNRTYTAQALLVQDTEALTLLGGFANCLGAADTTRTVLDGAGGAAAPVIRHVGSASLTLERLRIVGGDAINAGGGLDSAGTGTLRLQDVAFVGNRGVGGGGVAASAPTPQQGKAIYLAGDVSFIDNQADAGGGLFLFNGTIFPLFEPRLIVADNEATAGDGGGWYLLNSTIRPNVPGEGFGCSMVFSLNRASDRGGGLFVHARGGQSNVELRPARDCVGVFFGNEAGIEGGGVHGFADASLDAPSSSSSRIDIRLQSQQLIQNRAPDGAALMLRSQRNGDRQASAFLQLAPARYANDVLPVCSNLPYGACASIQENRAETAEGAIAFDAISAIDGGDGGSWTILQVANGTVVGNAARTAFGLRGPEARLTLSDSLAVGSGGDRVLEASDGARASILRSTIVHPGIEADSALRGDRHFLIEGSIAIVPGRAILRMSDPDNEAEIRDLLTDQFAVLKPGDFPPALVSGQFAVSDPGFVDPSGGNFRLRSGSPAIDRHVILDVDQRSARDLDLRRRGIDDPVVPNLPGRVWDLGAYEHADRVFANGFEAGGIPRECLEEDCR
jgi:hypothetical protein